MKSRAPGRTNGEDDMLRVVSLKLYSVSFDLLQPGNYASLNEKLRSLGAVSLLRSQWALRSRLSATELRNELRPFVDAADAIVVVEIGAEYATRRAKTNLAEL